MGNSELEGSAKQIAEAIQDLSRQLHNLWDYINREELARLEESARLKEYQDRNSMVEFSLVTSGTIKGQITRVGDQTLDIRTESGKSIMLYKHSISFIQEL